MNVLEKIVKWQLDIGMQLAPDSDMAAKHIGFVLEECGEALESIESKLPTDTLAEMVAQIAHGFKTHGSIGQQYTPEQHEALADAFADMAVYSIAGLMRCGYDPIKALEAVQESNDSKRLADGSFLKNKHGKILKPPHYVAPDLSKARVA